MSTKLNDIITLDEKNYVVASIAKLKKEQYYFVINEANENDIRFLKANVKGSKIPFVDVEDEQTIMDITMKVLKDIRTKK
jgi:formylmethanofuran:tetrahydromethanopterin formyltransferase